MSRFYCKILSISLAIMLIIANNSYGCDDTLIMLLTDKNPTSEFSKSIRTFMNSLTVLGSSLKFAQKDDYSSEVESTLNAWMEFSKKYMTTPPEEAKNDSQWISKMNNTAKKIGEIRKLVNAKNYIEAHNSVLELSNTIGSFFEASVDITDLKQLFITTSADLNDLQRISLTKNNTEKKEIINKLRQDLELLKKHINPDDELATQNTLNLIESTSKVVEKDESPEEIDNEISKLRTSFEELRSRILMREWFSNSNFQRKGE